MIVLTGSTIMRGTERSTIHAMIVLTGSTIIAWAVYNPCNDCIDGIHYIEVELPTSHTVIPLVLPG